MDASARLAPRSKAALSRLSIARRAPISTAMLPPCFRGVVRQFHARLNGAHFLGHVRVNALPPPILGGVWRHFLRVVVGECRVLSRKPRLPLIPAGRAIKHGLQFPQ
jgi:hypothetical protein